MDRVWIRWCHAGADSTRRVRQPSEKTSDLEAPLCGDLLVAERIYHVARTPLELAVNEGDHSRPLDDGSCSVESRSVAGATEAAVAFDPDEAGLMGADKVDRMELRPLSPNDQSKKGERVVALSKVMQRTDRDTNRGRCRSLTGHERERDHGEELTAGPAG